VLKKKCIRFSKPKSAKKKQHDGQTGVFGTHDVAVLRAPRVPAVSRLRLQVIKFGHRRWFGERVERDFVG
jgi:hypothetical protein